jgi:hypothetical protein
MSIDTSRRDPRGVKNVQGNTGKSGVSSTSRLDLKHDGAIHDADFDQDSYFPAAPESLTLADDLAQALGLAWTRRNPVWGSAALDRILGLQQTLMKKALTLPQDEKVLTLQAVKCLEIAANLRLRLEEGLCTEQAVMNNKFKLPQANQSAGTKPA